MGDFTVCLDIEKAFKSDSMNGNIFLLLQGGIVPVVNVTDKHFEQKYEVHYFDFGCISPNDDCIKKYNFQVLDYLNSNHPKEWKNEIRKDVIGFKEWKEK